ncbi:MAG: hypothetical protein EOO12_03530 [Chitinophagaceae bacterium]|nr:MAG: hypothetical protein EOO12_03530 [Chitinophagaceae bacterium]
MQRVLRQWETKLALPENLALSPRVKQCYLELLERQRGFVIPAPRAEARGKKRDAATRRRRQ